MGLFSKPRPEDVAADAATTAIGQALARKGVYDAVMASATEAERRQIEAAFDRHAARMREDQRAGW